MTIPSRSGLSVFLAAVVLVGNTGCGNHATADKEEAGDAMAVASTRILTDRVAESYVELVLAVGHYDPDYVDYYYGPPEYREEMTADPPALEIIERKAKGLVSDLEREPPARSDELLALRHRYLHKQLQSLIARVEMLKGKKLDFDTESRALYDATAPVNTEAHFQTIVKQLEELLPGAGPLEDRYVRFRSAFVIPPARLDTVFKRAIAECRRRTVEHIELPEDESFDVEYVTNKSWSAYNWYQGNYRSLIQVNTDLPIYIDRAVDLACHEGYPGHHVYNLLLEKNLVRDRDWMEFSVYPLFSPQSLISEGSANYGIEMAFPGNERVEFERSELFGLAGLDPEMADKYYRVQELAGELSYAGNEAARRYLNGTITASQAADWLNRFALMAPDRAKQRVRFIDQYRSYVINYNRGKDLVKTFIERGNPSTTERWNRFATLLSTPRLPSELTSPE